MQPFFVVEITCSGESFTARPEHAGSLHISEQNQQKRLNNILE